MTVSPTTRDELPPAMELSALVGLLVSVTLGALAATIVLPAWVPGLAQTLTGETPKAYWYLARVSGLVAYALLWLSMSLGVALTNRLARLWPGGPAAYDVHQHTSLLGLAFALFHALILLGDRFAAYTPIQLLVPFAAAAYRPVWVGLGQLGFYGLAVVGLSFYFRPVSGPKVWRAIHFLSFLVYGLALLHGLFSGTDTGAASITLFYWVTSGSLLFLISYRVLGRFMSRPAGRAEAPGRERETTPATRGR